jgi:spermidine/putrescine transport system ATP-binding protein
MQAKWEIVMADNAIELKDVTKQFPAPNGEVVTAVERMNLDIQNGEFFSFLGPSGCGKTTTLRMIAGFELPSDGEILIQGKPMGYTPPFKRPVNTVFQNYALWPHMSVAQNVAFGLEMKNVSKSEIRTRVDEALDLVHLNGMGERRPKQLSGGQQQRVALARALVQKPAVLLLDEPLGALDLKLRKAMQLELKHMQQQVGITFIYVTHDQEEALTMSDRIAVMNHGRVLQVGQSFEIYERPATRFVADFIGETNFLEGRVTKKDDVTAEVMIDNTFTMRAQADSTIKADTSVTIAVRPEKMSLHHPRQGDADTLPGKVEEMVYIGTDTRYIVRLAPNTTAVIRMQNLGEGMTVFDVGDNVAVTWDSDSVRVLTE